MGYTYSRLNSEYYNNLGSVDKYTSVISKLTACDKFLDEVR
jgi:hypothetical protein